MSGGHRAEGSGLSARDGGGARRAAGGRPPGPGSIGISLRPGERPRGTAGGFPLLLCRVPERPPGL